MELLKQLGQLEQLKASCEGQRRVNLRYSLYEFVLKFGTSFQYEPLPSRIRRGKPKHCFDNSARLAAVEGWIYVEGFGLLKDSNLPIYHAWVCKPNTNIVIDPTTNNIDSYFGVPFTHKHLRDHWRFYDSAAIIDNWKHDWPLFKMSDEEIRQLIVDVPQAVGTH